MAAPAVPPGYTLTDHGDGYTVVDPSGATVADGVGDLVHAVRAVLHHAAGKPVTVLEPSHTVSLPVRCTVAELRALLRRVPASARLADVRILDTEVIAGLTDLADVEMCFVGGST